MQILPLLVLAKSAKDALNSEGFVTDEQLEMLLEKGVAAELLGHFIQANGERLSTALDDTHQCSAVSSQISL